MLRAPPAHHRRQVLHLPPLAQDHLGLAQRRLALRTDGRPMLHHLVRSRHQVQRLAPMPQLSARLLAALLAQALRLAPQPVTAGWLAAVVAILGQACFQLLHTRQQRQRSARAGAHSRLRVGQSARQASCLYATPAPQVRLTCYAGPKQTDGAGYTSTRKSDGTDFRACLRSQAGASAVWSAKRRSMRTLMAR